MTTVASVAPVATTNLVLDASFDSGAAIGGTGSAWTAGGAHPVTKDDTVSVGGQSTTSVKMMVASGDPASYLAGSVNQTVPVTAGATYTVSGYYIGSLGDPNQVNIYITWLDSTHTPLSPTWDVNHYSPSSVWQRWTSTAVAPANAAYAVVVPRYFTNGAYSGSTIYAWWDDIQVEEGAFATSPIFAPDDTTVATRPAGSLLTIGEVIEGYRQLILRDKPVGYWPLTEASGTVAHDTGGNGDNGTITGGVTLGQPGPLLSGETAMGFDGTSGYVYTASGASPWGDLPTFSAEAWTNPNGAQDPSTPCILTEAYTTGSSQINFALYYNQSTTQIVGGFFDGSWHQAGPITLPSGQWSHVVVTYDGTTVALYLNGQLAATLTYAGSPKSSQLGIRIGRRWDLGDYFKGDIAQAAIYPTALTPAQVAEHYQMGTQLFSYSPNGDVLLAVGDEEEAYRSAVMADRPVGYWRLNEASGTVARDSSGYGNSGTVTGGVTLGEPGPGANGDTSMLFDGSTGYIAAPPATYFGPTLSVEGWVYTTAFNSWERLIDFANGAPSDNVILSASDGTTGVPTFVVANGSTESGFCSASGPISLNSWHHLAATYDGTTMRIYVDGALSGSLAYAGGVRAVTRTDNYIGRSNWTTDSYYVGSIAQVAVYDYALSAARIAAHASIGRTALMSMTPAIDVLLQGELQEGAVL